jgi:hypothetical protein
MQDMHAPVYAEFVRVQAQVLKWTQRGDAMCYPESAVVCFLDLHATRHQQLKAISGNKSGRLFEAGF